MGDTQVRPLRHAAHLGGGADRGGDGDPAGAGSGHGPRFGLSGVSGARTEATVVVRRACALAVSGVLALSGGLARAGFRVPAVAVCGVCVCVCVCGFAREVFF